MENEREQLRAILKEHSLMFGDFTLASGKKSTFYFDSKKTTLLPEGAWLTARAVLRVIREHGIEADAPRVTEAEGEDLGARSGHADGRIVRGRRAVDRNLSVLFSADHHPIFLPRGR